MFRYCLLLFLFFLTVLQATEPVEFYARHLDQNGSRVIAEGDVLIIYQDAYLTADKAIYDQNSSILELYGHVVTLKGSEYQLTGDYVKIDMKENRRQISPFYMLEKKSQLWLSAQKTSTCESIYEIDGGLVSGCDPENPMWEIYFSSSDYNAETKWLNLYNARFHIGGIPVLYLPYFGYSTDTTRRSGLLIPSVGLSGSEGVYYEQPLYIVVGDAADIEIKPQTRSSRGSGLYSTLRFVDSRDSKGALTLGYFQEKERYFQENSLQNDRHYGFDFNYENSKVFKNWFGLDLEGQSGLYIDAHWMNDVDYINLASSDTIDNVTSNQVFSRANLFYNEDDNYYGGYMKYYLELDPKKQLQRESTIQKLPTLQYHHYLDAFLEQHLFYTLNMSANNFARDLGKKGAEITTDLPLTLQTALFDEYVNVAYKAKLHGRMIDFRGEANISNPAIYEQGFYGSISHVIEAGSSVTKAYSENSHTMGVLVSYTTFGTDKKTGYYDTVDDECSTGTSTSLDCEFYTLRKSDDNVKLDFIQYVMDRNGKEKIYHRLSQPIVVGENSELNGLGEFENEFRWQITDRISLYDNAFYDFKRHVWQKTLNTIRYNDGTFNVGLSYLYENRLQNQSDIYTNYTNADLSYRYDSHYSYFTKYAYDIENRIKKYAEVGFLYSKRCWDFGLKYVENNRPVLLNGGFTSSVYDKYVYFTIIMKPLGGSEVNYRTSDTLRSN